MLMHTLVETPPLVTVRPATLADLATLVDGNAAMALETEHLQLDLRHLAAAASRPC